MSSVYDFEALSIDGQPVALSQFRGQPLLIVNTASACGFTPQGAMPVAGQSPFHGILG